MAKFELSAFADEYSPIFDEQIKGLKLNDIKYMEIRGVDGKSIADVTEDEAKVCKAKLDAEGLAVSSMGSPLGKIGINDDFDAHIKQLRHIIALSEIFNCNRIRMFSFYIPKGENPADYRGQVLDRLGKMLDIAKSEGVILCHENEKGIYGDTALRCLDIQEYFKGEIKCVFDHANFISCDDEPYPYAYELLKDYIFYMHIKDATPDKKMAPTGKGIGRIPETLDALRKYDKTFILTLEPHLQVFKGLDKLESTQVQKVDNQYATSAEAFKAAADALKLYI